MLIFPNILILNLIAKSVVSVRGVLIVLLRLLMENAILTVF